MKRQPWRTCVALRGYRDLRPGRKPTVIEPCCRAEPAGAGSTAWFVFDFSGERRPNELSQKAAAAKLRAMGAARIVREWRYNATS